MVDEIHKPGTMTRGPECRSGAALNLSADSMLMQSLQSLRERVLERLDSLETLTRNQSVSTPARGTSADQERAVERKLAELAETERKLQAQAERHEKEWSASLIQLESDRRLLAEAWEHVERERIAYASASELRHNSRAQSQGQQKGAPGNLPRPGALITARPAAADSDSNHPVAQAILRQFQTLSSDVRRNTQERRNSRSKGSRPES
jgi:DNA repair exonuclease SbcCD ATPase subunit